MKPCISQVTTLKASFAEDIAACAEAGWNFVEIWLTKLETYLEHHALHETRKLLEDSGVSPAAASFQGGLLQSSATERRVHVEHFRRRLDVCQALSIPVMVVTADFHQPVAPPEVGEVITRLKEAGQWAAGANVSLALEFRATSPFCHNLQTALALVDSVGEANVGVNLDIFHFSVGPSKTEDLGLLSSRNLLHVQACDLAAGLRELATDADRILPGDGDLDLASVFTRLRTIGYNGCVSLELMNPMLWSMKLAQVLEVGRLALERFVRTTEPRTK
jgi:sugar phosphate isomerase/epimerase